MPQYILREFKVTDARVSVAWGRLARLRRSLVVWTALPELGAEQRPRGGDKSELTS